MKKTIYIVQYRYYQYNSGQADNGSYWRKQEFEDLEKAKELYYKIKASIDKTLSEDENDQLVDDYIPYAGFFEMVKFFKSIVEEYDFDTLDKENNDFSNCPQCYCDKEGYSHGCNVCNNTGEREVNKSSVELAQSSKQWLNEKVMNLWSIYNKVFQLNYSLSNWSFYGDSLLVTAGYSCRGSVFEEDFELKKEWLWESDIEKILNNLKKIKDQQKEQEKAQEDLEKLESLKIQVMQLEQKVSNK